MINEGRVIEIGKHDELLEKQGVYYKLIQKQLNRKNSVINADEKDLADPTDDNVSSEEEDELRM